MARNSRAKRRPTPMKNTSSIDMEHGPRLRRELDAALEATPAPLVERIARTAMLSRREAHRFLDAAVAGEEPIGPEDADRARQVIDRLAEA